MLKSVIGCSGEVFVHFAAKNPHTCPTEETNAYPDHPIKDYGMDVQPVL